MFIETGVFRIEFRMRSHTIELRTNNKDEIKIRLQTTCVLAFANSCNLDSPDAYQILTGLLPWARSSRVYFHERTERIRRTQTVNHSVRVRTYDQFTHHSGTGGS